MSDDRLDLLDPDFEPTDEQLEGLMRGFIESVRAKREAAGLPELPDGPVDRVERFQDRTADLS